MTLKTQVKRALGRAHLYDRLKASLLYDAYWTMADRRVIDQRSREVQFYRGLLDGFSAGHLIFDVGANHGSKADIFLRLGARVVAVEPDDTNQAILRRRFLSLRFNPKPIVVVGQAVGDKEGVDTMWIDAPGSAKNTLSSKWVHTLQHDAERFGAPLTFGLQKQVRTVTLDRLIATYGVPSFIKIDVEGFEPSVLRGLSRPVPCVSFEVNLPEFRPEGIECVDLLRKLDSRGRFNYSADCRSGLALDRWLEAAAFVSALDACTDKSIEIFWRSALGS